MSTISCSFKKVTAYLLHNGSMSLFYWQA